MVQFRPTGVDYGNTPHGISGRNPKREMTEEGEKLTSGLLTLGQTKLSGGDEGDRVYVSYNEKEGKLEAKGYEGSFFGRIAYELKKLFGGESAPSMN